MYVCVTMIPHTVEDCSPPMWGYNYFIPISRLIINNVETPFGPQMKIEIPGEALGGLTQLETWRTWSARRMCVARQ